MRLFKKFSFSATVYVGMILVSFLFLQVVILLFTFSELDILKQMEGATHIYYFDKLFNSSLRLEQTVINNWTSSVKSAPLVDALQDDYRRVQLSNGRYQMDAEKAERLIDYLNSVEASGGFLWLDPQLTDPTKQVDSRSLFYIRDSNVKINSPTHDDILVQRGSAEIARKLTLSLDIYWQPHLDSTLDAELRQANHQVYQANRQTGAGTDTAYGSWFDNLDLLGDGYQPHIYIFPIVDPYSGQTIALVGVEVDEQLIKDMLAPEILTTRQPSGYAIAQKTLHSESATATDLETLTIRGIYSDALHGVIGRKDIAIQREDYNFDYVENRFNGLEFRIFSLKQSDSHLNDYLAVLKRIRPIDANSPYQKEDLSLVLFVHKDDFYYQSNIFGRILLNFAIISILNALLVTYASTKIMTLPIKRISKDIEAMDVDNSVSFSPTNVKELDLLLSKIEDLSIKVNESTRRMQNILELTGLSFIVMEENLATGKTHKIGKLSNMLGQQIEAEDTIEILANNEAKKLLTKHADHVEKIESDIDDGAQILNSVYEVISNGQTLYVKHVKKKANRIIFHVYANYSKEMKEKLSAEHKLNYDSLTSLQNRNFFRENVSAALQHNPSIKAAMIMWDLDNLKHINDTYGHDYGDMYLQYTASFLSQLKSKDSYISRFSGDEFFAFLPYYSSKEEVRHLIQELNDLMMTAKLAIDADHDIAIRASVGICWYPDDADNFDLLYRYADFAMYSAKKKRKGSIYEFQKDVFDREYILYSGSEDLNEFIDNQLLTFAYQPIVSIRTGEVMAYEALMRPTSPTIKSVYEVIMLAKAQAKLQSIEKLTFLSILQALDKNRLALTGKKIFINSIANVILPDDCTGYVESELAKLGDKIVIEITESEDADHHSIDTKQRYRKNYQTKIAVDDFGSGYSTERTLLRINPDYIKIDMTLIRNIDKDERRYQLVENIISYSKLRGTQVIAEGVQTVKEMEALITLGADYLQGYYLGKPHRDILDIDQIVKRQIRHYYRTRRSAQQ